MDEDGTLGWGTVQHSPAIVGFKDDDVFLVEGGGFGNYLQKSQRFTKASFLVALQDAMNRKEERERLAALSRSADRTKQLISFAIQHDQKAEASESPFIDAGGYELGQIAKAFKAPTVLEQSSILDALRTAKTPGERIVLLNLIRGIPLSDETMPVVAGFLPTSNAPKVREAAMTALRYIDGYKAVDYLVPYLVLDDPQLATVLENFASAVLSCKERTV